MDTSTPNFPVAAAPPRPAGLTTVCVITIVLSSLGLLTALQSVASMGMQSFNPGAAAGGAPPELVQIQQDMEAATRAIMRRFLPLMIAALVLQLGLCAGLLYGSIQTLRLRETGRKVLSWTYAAGLAIEPLRTALGCVVIYESFGVMQPFMTKMMNASSGGKPMPANVSQIMGQFMYIAGIASIVISIIWLLAKSGFFLWALAYLRRPQIRSLFQ
jgi:hypothetical protein